MYPCNMMIHDYIYVHDYLLRNLTLIDVLKQSKCKKNYFILKITFGIITVILTSIIQLMI